MSAYRFEQTTLQMVQPLPSMIRDHGLHAIEAELAIGGIVSSQPLLPDHDARIDRAGAGGGLRRCADEDSSSVEHARQGSGPSQVDSNNRMARWPFLRYFYRRWRAWRAQCFARYVSLVGRTDQ
jgi:hypothetical protein